MSVTPGTCRYCRCHGDSCPLANGERCVWSDRDRTVCSAAPCMRAEATRLRAANYDLVKARYWDWVRGLRKQRRAAKRRRKKAA